MNTRMGWRSGLVLAGVLAVTGCKTGGGGSGRVSGGWEQDFHTEKMTLAVSGTNQFFVLKSGYQLQLVYGDEQVYFTVLMDLKQVGAVKTRVVEERVKKAGETLRVIRHYYAMNPDTGDLFNFGQDVDVLHGGGPPTHEGSWLAEGRANSKNKPGLVMPGKPKVGEKFYQAQAPGVCMDRAEILQHDAEANQFANCLLLVETSPLNEQKRDLKCHAPGIGLASDGRHLLMKWQYINLR